MDTDLIVGKVIDGKEVISAKFDELSQHTTVYFADGNFKVVTPQEAPELFSDAETFVHVITSEDVARNDGFDGEIKVGDLISVPMSLVLTEEEALKLAEAQTVEQANQAMTDGKALEIVETNSVHIEDLEKPLDKEITEERKEAADITKNNPETND